MMGGDALKNAGKQARFDGPMRGNGFMVLAVALGGDTNVRASLAGDFIAQPAERTHKVAHRRHPAGASSGEDFVADEVQADDAGGVCAFVKVTIDGLANMIAQFLDRLRLGVDAVSKGGGDEAAFGVVLTHFKDDFGHV